MQLHFPQALRDTTILGTAGDDVLVQTASGFVLNGTEIGVTGLEAALVDGGGGTGDALTIAGTLPIPVAVEGVRDTIIAGTNGDDVIRIEPTSHAGEFRAYVNGGLIGTFIPTGQLIVYGLAGNDTISAEGVDFSVVLYGDDGDDILTGGSAHDIIFGGSGDDTITGAAGNDFLIGGTGKDRIAGSAGHDILVSSDVDAALDWATLRTINQQWAASHSASEAEAIDAA